jgi:hypothetical protein
LRFRATAIAVWIGGLASPVAVLGSGGCGGTVAGEQAPEDAGTEKGSDAPGGPDATVDVQPPEDGGGDLTANADAGPDASTRDVNAVDGDAGAADALAGSDADAGCVAGSARCNGQQPQVCGADGQWHNDQPPCPYGCVNGGCQGICPPGASQCNGNLVQVCDATGEWQTVTTCMQPTPDCQNLTCICAETLCSGQCIDLQTDPHNCGVCARDCQGGACQGGVCQSFVVASGSAVSDPRDLAVSARSIYWSEATTYGWIFSVPLGGGTPFTVSGGDEGPSALAIDTTSVYWLDSAGPCDASAGCYGNLFKAPLGGGPMVSLYSGGSGMITKDIAVDAINVYWTDPGLPGGPSVMSVPVNGGTPTTIASGLLNATNIALDAANVYWSAPSGVANVPSAVMTVPKAGGTPVTLAVANNPMDLAVDSTNVYWIDDGTSSVMTVPTRGGPPTTLVSNVFVPGSGIAIDVTNVYWSSNTALMTVPKSGGTPMTVTSGNGAGAATSIAVDSSAIYWIGAGAHVILKVAK